MSSSDSAHKKLIARTELRTSGIHTVHSEAKRVVLKGVSGGGGGGGGAEGRFGAPGFSSKWEEKDVALCPGATYVVLLGAGALGGAGAAAGAERGEDGCAGGVTSVLGVEGLVVLVGTRAVASSTPPIESVSSVSPTAEDMADGPSRFAIVDTKTGVVDNVVMASPDFFNQDLVQELVLRRRISAQSGALTLETRPSPASVLRLRECERVAPGWYWVSGTDASTEPSRFMQPANNPLPPVLRGIPGGRGAVRRRLTDEKLHFLIVATEWRSGHGGISTINRTLCRALATEGHAVVCLVPNGTLSESDRLSAGEAGVQLVEAPTTKGKDLGGLSSLIRQPQLPEGFEPDVVLGHGHVTGQAAQILKQDFYSRSACVHVIHTQPGEIEWYKDRAQNPSERVEASDSDARKLAQAAAVVVGVGPRLTRQAKMHVHGLEQSPLVVELLPGLEDWTGGENATAPPEVRCLFIGRADDRELKGLDLAVAAVLDAAKELRGIIAPTLIVRGASPGTGSALQRELSADFPNSHAVRVLEFTTDEEAVRRDYREASLVLVPSRTEGFGLVAMEAVSAGVPFLVSGESGFAEMIKRDYSEFADDFVVECSKQDARDVWASRVRQMILSREHFFRRVQQLRRAMMSNTSWQNSVKLLIAALRSIPPEA